MSYSNVSLRIELRDYLQRLINDHEIADFWMEDYGVELGFYKMTDPIDNRYILPEHHTFITGATINLEHSQERFRIMLMMNYVLDEHVNHIPNYKARISLDMNTGTELDEMEYMEVDKITEEFFSDGGKGSLTAIMENLIRKYYTDWEPEDNKKDDNQPLPDNIKIWVYIYKSTGRSLLELLNAVTTPNSLEGDDTTYVAEWFKDEDGNIDNNKLEAIAEFWVKDSKEEKYFAKFKLAESDFWFNEGEDYVSTPFLADSPEGNKKVLVGLAAKELTVKHSKEVWQSLGITEEHVIFEK